MEYVDKIVDFEYCKTCEHEKSKDYLEPCHTCLNNPTNVHSKKPVNYKEKEKKNKKIVYETKNDKK